MSREAQAQLAQIPNTVPPGDYIVDPAQSRVRIVMKHMFGLGTVEGTMRVASGTVRIAGPAAGVATVFLESASFRSGNRWRDKTVTSSKFLDATRFPVIEFNGAIEGSSADLPVEGTLLFREVPYAVRLELEDVAASEASLRIRATTGADRRDFGLRRRPGIVGNLARIVVELAARPAT